MLLPPVVAGSGPGHRFNQPGLNSSPGLGELGSLAAGRLEWVSRETAVRVSYRVALTRFLHVPLPPS